MVTLLTRRGAEGRAEEMPSAPDPEVSEQAKRRRLPAAYQARILAAADACRESAQIGVLLRHRGALFLAPEQVAATSDRPARWRRWRPNGGATRVAARTSVLTGVDVKAASSRALAQSDQPELDRFKRGLCAVMHTEF